MYYNKYISIFPSRNDLTQDYESIDYQGRVCFENGGHGYDKRYQVIGPIFDTQSEAQCFLYFLEFRCVQLATCNHSLIDDLKVEFEQTILCFRSDFNFSDSEQACEHLNDTQERSEREWPCNWTILNSLYVENDYQYDLTRVISSDSPGESFVAVIVETSNENEGILLDSDHPFADLFDVFNYIETKPDLTLVDISDSNREKYNIESLKAVA